jgi:hypothetical protein
MALNQSVLSSSNSHTTDDQQEAGVEENFVTRPRPRRKMPESPQSSLCTLDPGPASFIIQTKSSPILNNYDSCSVYQGTRYGLHNQLNITTQVSHVSCREFRRYKSSTTRLSTFGPCMLQSTVRAKCTTLTAAWDGVDGPLLQGLVVQYWSTLRKHHSLNAVHLDKSSISLHRSSFPGHPRHKAMINSARGELSNQILQTGVITLVSELKSTGLGDGRMIIISALAVPCQVDYR